MFSEINKCFSFIYIHWWYKTDIDALKIIEEDAIYMNKPKNIFKKMEINQRMPIFRFRWTKENGWIESNFETISTYIYTFVNCHFVCLFWCLFVWVGGCLFVCLRESRKYLFYIVWYSAVYEEYGKLVVWKLYLV